VPCVAIPPASPGEVPRLHRSAASFEKDLLMSVTLELSRDDARCLSNHLTRHMLQVDRELVHTERQRMRRELAAGSERLTPRHLGNLEPVGPSRHLQGLTLGAGGDHPGGS